MYVKINEPKKVLIAKDLILTKNDGRLDSLNVEDALFELYCILTATNNESGLALVDSAIVDLSIVG